MSQTPDHISLSIDEELTRLSPTPSEHCIFRVPDKLRFTNKRAYEPKIVTIGPYHRGNDKLQEMEEHKLRYLQQLLKRRDESSVDKYIKALFEIEERARKCYAEEIALNKEKFARMMLLDGFFIIELFRKWSDKESSDKNDCFLQVSQIVADIRHDLLLLENQLPFFIVLQLFNMTNDGNKEKGFGLLAYFFLNDILPGQPGGEDFGDIPVKDVKHLLHLVHDSMCASFAKVASRNTKNGGVIEWELVKSVTELQEAGIEFKKVAGSDGIFDIKFANGIMEVPVLLINDYTESVLRNLIAYEQFLPNTHQRYVTDYSRFIDCLISSPKDAAILRCCGIIDNFLGDDVVVCDMFNKLTDYAWLSDNYCYANLFNNVNKHCSRQWNTWMANLKHKYFNNPWAFISFVAAVVLLLLTITQTVFSVLSTF